MRDRERNDCGQRGKRKGEGSASGRERRERRTARRGQQTEQSDGTDKATVEWLGAHIVKAKAETYRKHVLVDRTVSPTIKLPTHLHTHILYICMRVYIYINTIS